MQSCAEREEFPIAGGGVSRHDRNQGEPGPPGVLAVSRRGRCAVREPLAASGVARGNCQQPGHKPRTKGDVQ
jgi:hypothetical protein